MPTNVTHLYSKSNCKEAEITYTDILNSKSVYKLYFSMEPNNFAKLILNCEDSKAILLKRMKEDPVKDKWNYLESKPKLKRINKFNSRKILDFFLVCAPSSLASFPL